MLPGAVAGLGTLRGNTYLEPQVPCPCASSRHHSQPHIRFLGFQEPWEQPRAKAKQIFREKRKWKEKQDSTVLCL